MAAHRAMGFGGMTAQAPGWYPDPATPGTVRWWDGPLFWVPVLVLSGGWFVAFISSWISTGAFVVSMIVLVGAIDTAHEAAVAPTTPQEPTGVLGDP